MIAVEPVSSSVSRHIIDLDGVAPATYPLAELPFEDAVAGFLAIRKRPHEGRPTLKAIEGISGGPQDLVSNVDFIRLSARFIGLSTTTVPWCSPPMRSGC
jgi:hypothetical protein